MIKANEPDEWIKAEQEIFRKNDELIAMIEQQYGPEMVQEIRELFKEDEGDYYIPLEIVSEPIGNHQDSDDYNGPVKGRWVDQTCNGGITGDSFAGTICLKIDEGKYLKYHYSM